MSSNENDVGLRGPTASSSSVADHTTVAQEASAALKQATGQAYAESAAALAAAATHGHSDVDPELRIHPTLRSPGAPNMSAAAPMMAPGLPQPPQIEQPQMMQTGTSDQTMSDYQPDSADGSGGQGKAKRELSSSKRAAQNRAAQRAFRQRKEGYIKKLEQQVRDINSNGSAIKHYQTENIALREYVGSLQDRLMQAQLEVPAPPAILTAQPPPAAPTENAQSPLQLPEANSSDNDAVAAAAAAAAAAAHNNDIPPTLDDVAQAVQSLSSYKDIKPDRDQDEASRQLQTDGMQAAPM